MSTLQILEAANLVIGGQWPPPEDGRGAVGESKHLSLADFELPTVYASRDQDGTLLYYPSDEASFVLAGVDFQPTEMLGKEQNFVFYGVVRDKCDVSVTHSLEVLVRGAANDFCLRRVPTDPTKKRQSLCSLGGGMPYHGIGESKYIICDVSEFIMVLDGVTKIHVRKDGECL